MNRLGRVHCTELLQERNQARNILILHVMFLVQGSLGSKDSMIGIFQLLQSVMAGTC